MTGESTCYNGGSVNCSFTLSGTAESAAAEKDYDVNADEGGSGASLHFTGNAKQEANALNVQKATGISTSDFTGSKGVFTLELSGNAKVTVHYKGSGAAETARAIIIASSTDTSIKGLDNIGNDAEADIETDSALSAGTYKIYCNGIKIFKITCGE
ncbi:MAG: hypothetical protein J6I53_05010 [Treponema sp.]|nr:hypothetical protein [Treponema sp.]